MNKHVCYHDSSFEELNEFVKEQKLYKLDETETHSTWIGNSAI